MLDDHQIRDFSGNNLSKQEFLDYLVANNKLGFNVYIGTDSKVHRDRVSVVTAICFHQEGKSGKVFYIKEKISRKQCPSLRSRMLLEAYRSIELAMELEPLVSNKIEIHLDVGDTIKSKTSAFEQELQSLVLAQGYGCAIKPFSFSSSAVADKVSRT